MKNMNTELNVNTPVDDYFRAHLPNQNETGGRKWLYPRATSGSFTRWRIRVAIVMLVALFAGPFVWIDGHPLFLFNVLERRFIFFGATFWPQDFYLVAIGLVTFVVFIALFTVVFGRVFCGWACPQTIFLEMIFRPIERWIEGDHNAQQRLDKGPWTSEKILKKTAKHSVFGLLSFIIGNLFLVYLIGRDQWLTLVTDNPSRHLLGLLAMLIFSGVFYGVFAHLREIVCTTICPYGRLQSVLLDKNSLIVAYDNVRGEPRGKRLREEKALVVTVPAIPVLPKPKGDCVDCKLCVQVCPTGIDIRNGTQMECINCTACIDACDEVMLKINRPPGLIRMDSQRGIDTRQPFRGTTRILAYSAVLVVLLGVLGFMIVSRPALDLTLLRTPGQMYQLDRTSQPGTNRVANLYSVELINKTYQPIPVRFRVTYPGAMLQLVQPLSTVGPGEMAKGLLFVSLPQKSIQQNSTPITIEVLSGQTIIATRETTFLGPVQ